MIDALIAGERDPGVLADLARGVMRKKIPDLTMACAGRFGDQHALMCGLHLEHTGQPGARAPGSRRRSRLSPGRPGCCGPSRGSAVAPRR
jgi:hypothetical protein